MAYFIIKLKNGDKIRITENEYKQIVGKKGLIGLPSCGETIDTNMIARILSEEKYNLELREKRRESDRGVLHDGTPVVRKFGRYYLLSDPEAEIDSTYYKEIAKDCVPTPQEYEQDYAKLPPKKRLEAILGTIDDQNRLGGGFKQLKDITKP